MIMKLNRSLWTCLPVRAALLCLGVLTLAACAAMRGPDGAGPDNGKTSKPQESPASRGSMTNGAGETPAEPLTKKVLYDVLLAEIAGQRGRLDVAAPHYLQAALESSDPRVAERAVQIAAFAKEYKTALRAAHHWLELDPSSVEARKVIVALSLKTGDLEEVVTQLDYLIGAAGNRKQGFQQATAVLARHANKAEALAAMEQLAGRYPDSPPAHLAVSRLALLAGEPERALSAVDAGLQMQPDLVSAVVLKAQIQISMDRKPQATDTLAKAVARRPDHADLRFAYGRLLLDGGDLQGAKKQFGEVIRLEPDNNDAVFSLALLELETGDLKPAEQHLHLLLKRKEKLQAVYYYLGYAAEEDADNAAALGWYRKIDEGEYWIQSRLRLSQILVKQGKLEDMRHEMQALRRNNPEQAVELYLIEGQVLTDTGLDKEAFDLYTEALLNHPDDEKLLYSRALAAEKIDRLDTSVQDLQQILKNDPDNVRALNALGYTLADRTDRYTEALAYIKKAYAREPNDPAIMDSLGWVHYRLGDLDKAREYLQQAFDQSGDAEIGAHLGEVLWKNGDPDAARRVWNKALEKNPDNPVLREVMQRYKP